MNGTIAPCDCCAGVTRQTPRPIQNRPGLSQIAYRAGTHATFKASLLSALSNPAYAALAPLTTRDDSDFTIALLDAWAVSADILTFYQERIANESYLRTSLQPRSVFELARLVGYQPSPGVAAAAPLAFTLNEAPGAPATSVIPAGTRVRSVPAPGQTPQTFETSAALTARVAHNALPAVRSLPVAWSGVTTSLWLDGTAAGLKPGDAVLFVDDTRITDATSTVWEFRILTGVTADAANRRTLIQWNDALWAPFHAQATHVTVYALRKRASLYGANAPDPNLLSKGPTNYPFPAAGTDWSFTHPFSKVDLDTTYPSVTASSPDGSSAWMVLALKTFRQLYRITSVADVVPLRYTLSGKATELTLDSNAYLNWLVGLTREATAFVQSEALPLAGQPVTAWSPPVACQLATGVLAPVEGSVLDVVGGTTLVEGQMVAVGGKRLRLTIAAGFSASFVPADGQDPITAIAGDTYLIDAFPPPAITGVLAWTVLTTDGVAGTLQAASGAVLLAVAETADAVVTEAATISKLTKGGTTMSLQFASPLARIYDRATVTVNANVVPATHGETVQELLGSGDGSVANQRFTLKQEPLTFTSAPSGEGTRSTLQVWVNDLRWQERANLLDSMPTDRVFTTSSNSGMVTLQFGDGVRGARPATGQMNVRAVYRKGIGVAGMVRAGQLTQAIDRPAGLKDVTNPAPATGGADPATPDDARRSAPLHVRTLDRVVSLEDYENTAAAFAGIAKALATWTWFGHTRGVVVTVAGPAGAALDPQGQTIGNLITTYRDAGNPYVPLQVLPYQPRLFRVGADVRIDTSTYDTELVLAQLRAALADAFGFDARTLGQSVAQSAVVAVMQSVSGVLAVRLTAFWRQDQPQILPPPAFLIAAAPSPGMRGVVAPAELLTIDPATLPAIGATP